MKEQILRYFELLNENIPMAVYEGLLTVLCTGVIILIACYGLKRGCRKIIGLILAEYVFVIYCSTVIFRTAADGNGHEFRPFWSYEAIQNGRTELLAENVMNMVVFAPIGVLLGSLFKGKSAWLIILAIGIFISGSIEALQYGLKCGLAETDDVMHNTIGCLIGYGIISLARKIIKV